MKISEKLKNYIENNIFPSYAKNDLGHNLDHIKYVINRSIKFAETIPNINMEMGIQLLRIIILDIIKMQKIMKKSLLRC